MVAIVSGNSLGLGQTSLATLGQHGRIGNPLHGRNGQGVHVNVATGNLVLQNQDEYLAGTGADIATVRTYNSLGETAADTAADGAWSMSLARPPLVLTGTVNTAGSRVTRTAGDGAVARYSWIEEQGAYVSREGDGAYDTIAFADGKYTWTDGSTGATEVYQGSGDLRLLAAYDAAGKGFTFQYDATYQLLVGVTSNDKEQTRYSYSGGLLTQVSTQNAAGELTGKRVAYAYDAEDRLVLVTVDLSPGDSKVADGNVYTTRYTYVGDKSRRVATVTQDDGNTLTFTYKADGRLASVTDALKNAMRFTYVDATTTEVTDALGHVTKYEVDTAGQLTRVTQPGTAGAVDFDYVSGNLVSVTDGTGAKTTFAYDARGNCVAEKDATGARIERTFDARNQLLTETVRGSTAKTTHIYFASRPELLRFTVSPEGRVTRHSYDDAGNRTITLTYGGDLYTAGERDEESLLAWAGLQGSDNVQRVQMAYDARGQLSTRTVGGDVETFVYDPAGRLLKQIAAGGGITQYTYDGLGRVLVETDAANKKTVTQYDDAGRRTVVTLANGLVKVYGYDAAGQLGGIGDEMGGVRLATTLYSYDDAGQLRMTRDPSGVRSWMLYDAAGRKVADVDGNGTLTEYAYDAAGRLAWQGTYATAADTSLLVDAGGKVLTEARLATVRPAGEVGASRWFAYDRAGRLVQQAVSTGVGITVAVTSMEYDDASRLVGTRAYANVTAVPASAHAAIKVPVESEHDRVTRYFHDADGRRTGVLDAEGYLAETIYSAAGLAVRQVSYARAVATALREKGSLPEIRPASSGADARTHTFYDSKGRAVAVVDAEGRLSRSVYDKNGNVVKTVLYATKVGVTLTAQTLLAEVVPKDSPEDRTTDRTYDILGRLASEVTPDGFKTTFAYDAQGRLLETVRAQGTADQRTFLARYDVQGRLTGELSGEGAALLTADLEAEKIDAIWASEGITHAYDRAGRRVSTTDAVGSTTFYFYDEDSALTHTVNALGEVREQRYDAQGRLVRDIAYNGRISTADLDGGLDRDVLRARLEKIADDAGYSYARYTYTASGQMASRTDPAASVTAYAYNAFGDRIGVEANGHGTEAYVVDRRGLQVGSNRSIAGPNLVTSTAYDAFGRTISTVDANGNQRSYSFDRVGRQVATTDPLGEVRRTTYDAFDRVLTQTDALGKTTRYAYDRATRSITVTTPEGIVTSQAANVHGEISRAVDGNGNATTYAYDRDGKLVQTASAATVVSNAYDDAGRLVRTTDGNGVKIAYAYDAASRLVSRTVDPGGLALVTCYSFDGQGRQVSVTDPEGVATVTTFDRGGRVLTQVVDPTGLKLKTSYSYDEAGRVLTVRSPEGNVTAYVYDLQGRRVEERIDPDGLNLRRSWTYDGNGNAITSTDARGFVTRNAYDAADRLVYTVDGTGAVVKRSYDGNGNLVRLIQYANTIAAGTAPASVTAGAGDRVTSMVYDADNRMVFRVDPMLAATQQVYDDNGQLVRRVAYATPLSKRPAESATAGSVLGALDADAASDRITRYGYDAAGRQVIAIDAAGGMTATQYDANGNATAITRFADLVSASTLASSSNVPTTAWVTADATIDRTTRYAYDAAGRRVYEVDPLGAVTAARYDDGGRVLSRTRHAVAIAANARSTLAIAAAIVKSEDDRRDAFSYDAAGRLVGTTDALGGKEAFTVDAEGRRLSFVNKEGARWTYAYDAAGRMVSETSPEVSIASITYDSGAKTVVGIAGGLAGVVTRFAYDALGNLTHRTEAAGRPQERTTRYAYDAAGRQVRVVFPKVGVYDPTEDALTDDERVDLGERAEDNLQLETRTFYDAFGNAVAGIDVGGAVSQKAYDTRGDLAYEVDALGYVTAYKRNAFGEVFRLTRSAQAIAIPQTIETAADAAGAAAITAAVKAHADDRILLSTYDRAGRLALAQEPSVYVYQHVLGDKGEGATVSKTTRHAYNAFGERVQSVALRGIGEQTATTTHYFDRAGREIATVDALGYLTRRSFDAVGNLLKSIEYAEPLAEPWSRTSYGATPGATSDDRRTDFTYDLLDRKTAEKRMAVSYMSAAGTSVTGDLSTRYAYDAVGNPTTVTDAAGRVTLTYYDALGRVQAIASPKRGVYGTGVQGGKIVPLTVFRRDAHGQVLATIEYAQGAVTANSSGYTTAAHADDRKTLSAYDALGRKVVTVDASGHNQYYSYDAHGNLAKQWQQVEGDGKTGTTYQVHVYDKLGRLAQTIVPNSRWAYVKAEGKIVSLGQEAVGVVKTTMKYNGFGEMTSKRLTSSGEEQFHYDRAGRLWRTNSGDGVWRVHLFDLQGNVTSEIRSPGDSVGSIDLSGADLTAAAADKLLGTRRIDSVYDALGRLAAREEASRREQQGGVIAVGQQVEAVVESATDVGIGSPYWLGKNRVVLSWNSLAALGSGDVKVTIEYQAATTPAHADSASINDNGFRSYTSGAMTSAVGASGATLEWSEHSNEWYGGISHVTRVLVQKKDVNGVWRTAIDQATGYGGSVIDLATPPNPDAGIKFEMRKSGTAGDAGWFAIGTYDFGARRRFDANGLAPGSYEYRVHVQTPGEDWHLTSNGTIELGSPLLNAISASMGFGKTGAGMFSWKAPAAGVGQDFRYRLAGGTGIWRSIDIETNAAGLQVVDTRVLDAGNYDFELLWSRTDHGVPVSHAIGTFTVGSSPAGSISSKPGTAAISTSEGGTLAQDKDLNGESRWLRPQVRHNVDRWGNVVTITDPRSSKWKTTYTYNANNQKVSETLPSASDGPGPATARYYFDELGRQVAVRDANGNVNRQTWDAGGQLIAETHADGGVVSHGYNAFGNKTWSRDAEGGFVTFKYDDLGRMTGLSKGVHTVYAIGSDNETVNEATREITEKWSYDALGQVISHTNGNGQKVTYSYDLLGNLVQTKQPLGQASRSAYDAFGRKVAEVDAAGASRTWTYGEFGALKAHKDLGGNEYAYSYDNAGQLTSRTTKDGAQVLGYVYDGAGQLTVMTDSDLKKTTTYGYDLAGRRVREKVVQGSTTFQDNHLSYDARGRLRDVADSRVHLVMEYDAVGNRTRIQSRVNYQGVEEEVTDKSDRFFLYDAMNRQTTVDGINAAGVIGTDQGHTISYDKNGNRTKDVFYGNRVTGEWVEPNDHHPEYGTPGASVYTYKVASARIAEVYTYDPLNRLTTVVRDGLKVDVRLYDGADRVVRSGPVDVDPERMAKVNEGSDPASSHSADIRLHRYDANGRLLNQRVRSSDGVTLKTDTSWDPSKGVAGYIPDGYDEAGNVLGYVVVDYQADTRVEYRNSFALYGNYQTLTTAAKSNKQGTGSTTHEYDANGFLVAVTDAIQSASNRKFVNDAEGRVLYAKQAGHIKRQLIANGEVLGTYGVGVDPLGTNGVSFADHADFNFGYERVSASYPSAAPSAYQVQSGDTLQGIAQSAYGDSSLWYRIADANGFSSSSELRAGQTISIPNRVGTISNNSTTFKPYDPTRMVGDTTPNLPPPAQGGGCGGVGQVLMLVVAVVVTIYTAGLLTPAVSGAATGFGATMAAGMGTLGAGTVASVATGVVAAGVGSVASQLVGLATGTIDKFSWKQVASAAIGGGIAAGLPASGAFAAGGTGVVARAVAGNALSQGVAVAVGLQDSFSWVRVAASAVGAGLGHAAGPAVANAAGGGAFGDFASSLTTGLVTGAAVHVMSGGRVSAHQVAVDAFGNALGQSLAASSSSVEQRPSYSLVEGQLTGGQGLKAPAGLWDDVGPSSTYGYESNAYVDYSIGSARLSGSTGVPTQGDTVLEAWRTNRGGEVESLGRWAVTPAQVMGAPAYVDPDTGTETRAVSVYAGRAQMRDLPPLPPAATQRSVDVLARAAQDAQDSYRDAQHQAVAEGDAVGFVTAKFGGLAAEVGYDAARAGRGLYRLFTDGEARAQAVGQLKYLAANPKVIVDGAVQAAADFARKPFDEQADSVFKGGLGLFAGAGVGKVGLTAGELTLQGAGRTAQWLAPTAERVIFNQMDRIGLVVRVVPDAPRMNAGPVMAGEAGRFGGLHARRVTGDGLTPHHMPQAGAGRTAYEDGGALVMTHAEHLQTRTWGSKGIGTLRSDAGLSFREVLYNDIRDVRSIVGTKYNAGLRDLADYYRRYYPDLMQK